MVNWFLTKIKTDKLDLKFETGTSKDTVKKVKRCLIKWDKVFANQISDKEIVSRIYKELIYLNNLEDYPVLKWAKNSTRCFSKEDIKMANNHMKRSLVSLAIREPTSPHTRCVWRSLWMIPAPATLSPLDIQVLQQMEPDCGAETGHPHCTLTTVPVDT